MNRLRIFLALAVLLCAPCIILADGLGDFKKSVERDRDDETQKDGKKKKDKDKDKDGKHGKKSSSDRGSGIYLFGDLGLNVIHFGNPYLYGTIGDDVTAPESGYALAADMHAGILEKDINEFGLDLVFDFGGAGFELNNFYFSEELDSGETDTLYIGYINGFMGVGEYTYYSRFKFGIIHIFGESYTGGWNLGFEQSWYPGGGFHIDLLYEAGLLRQSLLADFAVFMLDIDSETYTEYANVGVFTRASVSAGYTFWRGEIFGGYIHFLSSPTDGDAAEMSGFFGGFRFWV